MSVAFRPRRASIRRRLLAAFVFLALSMGAALGLAGRLSFDSLGTALLAWHTRPVMDALMEAERRAWEAEDRGGEKLYYGEDLAARHALAFSGRQRSARPLARLARRSAPD